MLNKISNKEVCEIAEKVINIQKEAIGSLNEVIKDNFIEIVEAVSNLKGKLIISGMGKSGNIARKISSTLSSTGTPSLYLSPAEAKHGDVGVISKQDMVMLLSNSGETDELNAIINYCKRFDIKIISMTRGVNSTLHKVGDMKILLPAIPEASDLGVPTTSSTMMIVYGDALAVALHHKRNFSKEDYKILHPGGSIGAQLTYLKDLMHVGHMLPIVEKGTFLLDAVLEMTKKRMGCVGVVDEEGSLIGVITDGDLRRHLGDNIRNKAVENVMTINPKTLSEEVIAIKALGIMNENSITNVFIVKNGKPIGVVHIHDLLKLGVV